MTRAYESENSTLVDHLRLSIPGLIAVYRFGSTAQGQATAESDTDVAVFARDRLSSTTRFDLQEQLAARVGHDVDLVDLRASSPVMAIQVITRGQLLYDADPAVRGAFEDLTFSAYARLNEERRGILARVAAEGTIYGR